MTKVSIENELLKVSKEEKKSSNIDDIKEIKLLLNSEETEDLRILRGLSHDSQFNRVERFHGQQLQLEKLENEYGGKVYTKNQIKKLAVDYKLRFLPSQYFRGAYDVEVTSKIKEFAKTNLAPIDDFNLSRRFFILAPEELFVLKEEKYVTKRQQLDPAIFFKIDDDHYRLIHKWGADFTILRYLKGYRWKGYYQHWLFNIFMVLPIVTFLFLLCLPYSTPINYPILTTLGVFGITILFTFLRWQLGKVDDFDIIQSFFTPTNWDTDSKIKN